MNSLNLYNQVGIVAINFLGEIIDNPASTPPILNERKSYLFLCFRIERNDDLAVEMHFDKQVSAILKNINNAKKQAVENEDYIQAKAIKLVENDLKELGIRISKLELAKKLSVEEEDYDKAAQLKVYLFIFRKILKI